MVALAWFPPAAISRALWLILVGFVYGAGVLLSRAVTPADLRLISRRVRPLQVVGEGDQP